LIELKKLPADTMLKPEMIKAAEEMIARKRAEKAR
jgi:hypothetical protein